MIPNHPEFNLSDTVTDTFVTIMNRPPAYSIGTEALGIGGRILSDATTRSDYLWWSARPTGTGDNLDSRYELRWWNSVSWVYEGDLPVIFSDTGSLTGTDIAFNRDNRIAVCYEEAAGVGLNYYNPLFDARVDLPIAGASSPKLVYDAPGNVVDPNAELLLFYVHDNKVYMRLETENFGVEYYTGRTAPGIYIDSVGMTTTNKLQLILRAETEPVPVIEPWSVYVSSAFSFSGYETNAQSAWKLDGRWLVLGSSGQDVTQFREDGTYFGPSYSIGLGSTPDFYWDGTNWFVITWTAYSKYDREFNLIETLTWPIEVTYASSLCWDGSFWYVLGGASAESIWKLNPDFSYTGEVFDAFIEGSSKVMKSIRFFDNRFWLMGKLGAEATTVYEYNSSLVYSGNFWEVPQQETPTGLFIDEDDGKCYTVGRTPAEVIEYSGFVVEPIAMPDFTGVYSHTETGILTSGRDGLQINSRNVVLRSGNDLYLDSWDLNWSKYVSLDTDFADSWAMTSDYDLIYVISRNDFNGTITLHTYDQGGSMLSSNVTGAVGPIHSMVYTDGYLYVQNDYIFRQLNISDGSVTGVEYVSESYYDSVVDRDGVLLGLRNGIIYELDTSFIRTGNSWDTTGEVGADGHGLYMNSNGDIGVIYGSDIFMYV